MANVKVSVSRWFIILLIAAAVVMVNDAKGSDVNHYIWDGLPCDEFYVVKKGETIDSIAEKCDDPFILFSNPEISHPEDIFPGYLLIINSPF